MCFQHDKTSGTRLEEIATATVVLIRRTGWNIPIDYECTLCVIRWTANSLVRKYPYSYCVVAVDLGPVRKNVSKLV